jgi:hypothetical protein
MKQDLSTAVAKIFRNSAVKFSYGARTLALDSYSLLSSGNYLLINFI